MGNTNDGNTKLIEKLRAFQEGVKDRSNLEAEFSKLAEYLLGSGHFSVDYGDGDGYDIYLKDIEFYFHEEQGPEKDYIVYHRDNHKDYKPVIEDKTRKYLPVGSFYDYSQYSNIDCLWVHRSLVDKDHKRFLQLTLKYYYYYSSDWYPISLNKLVYMCLRKKDCINIYLALLFHHL